MMDQRILALADDDELHAELLSVWLEHHGYQVLRFSSGDELVTWASTGGQPVDAFVLDVDMPGRDGFQSCRELRTIQEFSRVPAVFVSAAAPESMPAEVAGQGVQFIRKDEKMFVQLADWLTNNIYQES